ncbi:MAG: IclR family transcriptional regulator [Candidatus Dormibacteraceae bacterium]
MGSELFVLGSSYGASLDLVREANSVAFQVMARCDETVQVAVLEGREVLYVAKADSPQAVRLVSEVGKRLPAHCTALGKVMLAALTPADFTHLFAAVKLEVLTPRSISDLASLEVHLGQIRGTGHASEHGESNPDAGCVAAPIRNSAGTCVAAMSIAAPLSRLNRKREMDLVALVVTGAEELSQRLGYRVPTLQQTRSANAEMLGNRS